MNKVVRRRWTRRNKKIRGKGKYHSISRKLKYEGRSDDTFEEMMTQLSLEEVIGLKLELAARSAGNYMYNLPLWRNMLQLTKEALIKFAVSATRNKSDAARLLGISYNDLTIQGHRFNIQEYYRIIDERMSNKF